MHDGPSKYCSIACYKTFGSKSQARDMCFAASSAVSIRQDKVRYGSPVKEPLQFRRGAEGLGVPMLRFMGVGAPVYKQTNKN